MITLLWDWYFTSALLRTKFSPISSSSWLRLGLAWQRSNANKSAVNNTCNFKLFFQPHFYCIFGRIENYLCSRYSTFTCSMYILFLSIVLISQLKNQELKKVKLLFLSLSPVLCTRGYFRGPKYFLEPEDMSKNSSKKLVWKSSQYTVK